MVKSSRKREIPSTPKTIKHGFTLNDKFFRWTLTESFWEHRGWQNCPAKFFAEHIINKLQNFEQMTWQEILNAAGGKSLGRGNNNHFILWTKLPVAERKEFARRGYGEAYDKVFSLRLSGQERLIGVVDGNIFKVLWFDALHEFF